MDDTTRAAEQAAHTGQRIAEHLDRTGPVLGRASSPDGAVTVTTPPGTPPTDIRVTAAALNMGPQALAAEIVRVAAKASRDAAARLHRSLDRVVDPATSRALTEMGFAPGEVEDDFTGGYLRGPR
ncbi:hypothetical protein GCM10022243_06530 [Saccharothrix violaceirubra]|uniref:YbaB/EbfC DNA-binding family protein n=1 Tax=Saccharothrix violaceirubra TaxID=413306 RepID=A0A7W7WTD2_9PSEU|nr:hypothetical protein [Saccharothrix violaceirubra]MBB4963065.1 hypothetical protein [Saccharothrix violaceirubra]